MGPPCKPCIMLPSDLTSRGCSVALPSCCSRACCLQWEGLPPRRAGASMMMRAGPAAAGSLPALPAYRACRPCNGRVRPMLLLLCLSLGTIRAVAFTPEGQDSHEETECQAAHLEVRRSTVEGGGLGLFVACEAGDWVGEGTLLTEYGDRDRLVDGLESLDYAMGITGRPHLVRWGPRWEGPVPAKVPPGWQAGQMMNDAASVALLQPSPEEGGPLPGLSGLLAAVEDYERVSMARVNVGPPEDPASGRWGMHASRTLWSGEELFIPYGAAYWLNRLLRHSPAHSPLTALLVYACTARRHPDLHPDGSWRLLPVMAGGAAGWPMHSRTGVEASEDECRQLLNSLGFEGEAGRKALARVGLMSLGGEEGTDSSSSSSGRSSKELLWRLVEMVVDPPPIIGDGLPTGGAETDLDRRIRG